MIDGIVYRRGAVLDTPHRRMGYRRPQWANTLSTGIVSLAEYQCRPFDQGPTNSCEGHRAAMAIQVVMHALGIPLPFVASPDGIYRDARCVPRRPHNHLLPPLQDEGAMTGDVFTALGWMGVRPIGADVDGRHSDCSVAEVNREPRLDELILESNQIVTGEQTLDVDGGLMGKILYHLENKRPISLDVWVDTAFEQWGHGGTEPLSQCDRTDPTGGWHAILCTEIEVTSAGSVILSGPNSWGSDWGMAPIVDNGLGKGMWRATGEWVLKAADAAHVWCIR